MHKLTIDDEMIKAYLSTSDLSPYAKDEVFLVDNEEVSLYQEPKQKHRDKVASLYQAFREKINPFTFPDEERVFNYLGDLEPVLEHIVIKFVVGLPKPITKFFRVSPSNIIYLVIDLGNIISNQNDITKSVNELYDYVCYFLCLMALDIHSDVPKDDYVSIFKHSVYSASFAFYLASSKQLERLKDKGHYDMLLYIEEAMLHQLGKQKKRKIFQNYMKNIYRTNPELEHIGITGKTYLNSLVDKGETHKIKTLYSLGSNAFVDTVRDSRAVKKKALPFRFYAWLTLFIPLYTVIIITWGVIEIINRTFSLYLQIQPILFGGVMLIHQLLKLRVHLTKLHFALLYLVLIVSIIIFYLLFIMAFTG